MIERMAGIHEHRCEGAVVMPHRETVNIPVLIAAQRAANDLHGRAVASQAVHHLHGGEAFPAHDRGCLRPVEDAGELLSFGSTAYHERSERGSRRR